MRPRTEALIGFGALALLGLIAAIAGSSRRPVTSPVADPSTFLAGPGGSLALLEATQRLGIDVRRFRDRPLRLQRLADRPRQLLVILDPTQPITAPELDQLVRFNRSADLLIAGRHAEKLLRCFGYEMHGRLFDSVPVKELGATAPRVDGSLEPTHERVFTDSSRAFDAFRTTCQVPAYRTVTTLLTSPRGLVAVRLERQDNGHLIILAADAALFENRQLRNTAAGTFALALMAGHYDHVVFDEYHHGYGASGSLFRATMTWSYHSPWGWAAWQLTIVGVLALLFGAVRFGPALPGIVRRRRSPLEHVRALATALSAAHGHDQAIAAMVRGLRRRLAPAGLRSRGDWHAWLEQLTHRAMSPSERQALTTLTSLTRAGQPADSVLQAANAVEDLWQTLQH